jgi:septum site-determining protein MinC
MQIRQARISAAAATPDSKNSEHLRHVNPPLTVPPSNPVTIIKRIRTAVTAAAAEQTRPAIRFRGRSFLALVLQPEPPVPDWLGELDEWLRRSPGFFRGRPVVMDVGGLQLDKEGVASLIGELDKREIRLMGIEGTKSSYLTLGMPPLVSGGRGADTEAPNIEPVGGAPAASAAQEIEAPRQADLPPSLLIDRPVRSGQAVFYPQGDVTIVGSVASGAEVVAGGSIHIYGALRGRAIAGSTGNPDARIFCGKLHSELLAIDGLYRTAEDMDPQFIGNAVQVWLEGNAIRMAALA